MRGSDGSRDERIELSVRGEEGQRYARGTGRSEEREEGRGSIERVIGVDGGEG